ncbi:MAG: type II secretion system protein M [Candidatus Riflebacteria bacterium]|nr:type II secretion system protein M [Candidatus Riflebacteria bacterium]
MIDTLGIWWNKGLDSRERRALLILAIIGPALIFWWGVTRPLLDRRESLRRAADVLEKQHRELVDILRQADEARIKIGVVGQASDGPLLPFLEKKLGATFGSSSRTILQPAEIRAGGTVLAGARLDLKNEDARRVHEVILLLASYGMLFQDMELTRNPDGRGINGHVTVRRSR